MTADQQVCPECSEAIEDDSLVCASCGHDFGESVEAHRSFRKAWWVAAVAMVVAVIGISIVALGRNNQRDAAQAYSTVNFASPTANGASLGGSTDLNATVSNSTDANVDSVAENLTNLDESDTDVSATSASPPEVSAKIEDWSWESDPDFGTEGAIKWRVSVRNVSDREIASAKVEFSAFDEDHHLITTTFDYVQNIPAGDTRNEESFADYHGGEATARVAITDIRFAN